MLSRLHSSTKKFKKIFFLLVCVYLTQINAFSQTENLKVLESPVSKYPAAALAVKASGVTTCRTNISQDGTVEKTEMLSGHPLLRFATEASVKKWKFNAISDQSKRETIITIEYLITEEKSLNQEQTVEFKNPFYAVIKAKQIKEIKTCCPNKSFFGRIGSFFIKLFT